MKGRGPLGRAGRRWKYNTKMDVADARSGNEGNCRLKEYPESWR